MILDIREDIPDILAYIRRRVDEHLAESKPHKQPELVRRIDFGFEFGQANWVALVFDTRENAEPDGEWSMNIDEILLNRPKWPIWHKLPDEEHVYFIDLTGKKVDVMGNPDEMICGIVGEALRHVLLTARDQGIFKPLSKAERCELGVENLEGYFGWPKHEDRGRENLV